MKIKIIKKSNASMLLAGTAWVGSHAMPFLFPVWLLMMAKAFMDARDESEITLDLGTPRQDIAQEVERKRLIAQLEALEQGARWGLGDRKNACLEKLQVLAKAGVYLESARDLVS